MGGGGFMTQLQQKYCGHARLQSDDDSSAGGGGTKKRKKRTPADDMYELDDDFIDDSELFEVFEKQEEAETVVTKYSGFFVNKGELEIEKPPPREPEPAPKEKKKRIRNRASTGNANGEGGGSSKENEGSAVMKKAGVGGGGGGSTTSSLAGDSNSVNESAAANEAAAMATFQGQVAAWLQLHGGTVSAELPQALALPALALDLVMRRRGGTSAALYKSTGPGEAGISLLYITTVLQPAFGLAGGMEDASAAWRDGLVKAAVRRVKELQRTIEDGKAEFKRQYDAKQVQLASKIPAAPKPADAVGVGEGGGGAGGGGGEGDMAAPATPVPIFQKLKQLMYSVLTSLKEKNAIQVLYAGEGRGQEDGALLPLVAPNFAVEEKLLLTQLANTWPNDTMKLPRLRRAFNQYKNSEGTGDGGGGGGSSGAGKKPSAPKDGAAGGAGAGAKKKPSAKKKKPKGPWKGSFASIQSQPYNAADFEVEGAVRVAVAPPPPPQQQEKQWDKDKEGDK